MCLQAKKDDSDEMITIESSDASSEGNETLQIAIGHKANVHVRQITIK